MSLLDEIAGSEEAIDEYDRLPASLQASFTRKEWAWMSDEQKANLTIVELEPEIYDDE